MPDQRAACMTFTTSPVRLIWVLVCVSSGATVIGNETSRPLRAASSAVEPEVSVSGAAGSYPMSATREVPTWSPPPALASASDSEAIG